MDAIDFFLGAHAVVHSADVADAEGGWSAAEAVLHGTSDDDLRQTPFGENSIAWALWHAARLEDACANLVVGRRSQVFDDGDYEPRLAVGRRDMGVEMTKAEMKAMSANVDLGALKEYRDAVGRRTREVATSISPQRWSEVYTSDDAARVIASGALIPAAHWLANEFWMGRSMAWFLHWTCVEHNVMHLSYGRVVKRLLRSDARR